MLYGIDNTNHLTSIVLKTIYHVHYKIKLGRVIDGADLLQAHRGWSASLGP